MDVAYVDGDVAQAASTATGGMPPKALQSYSQVVAQAPRAAQVSPREVWNVEGVSLQASLAASADQVVDAQAGAQDVSMQVDDAYVDVDVAEATVQIAVEALAEVRNDEVSPRASVGNVAVQTTAQARLWRLWLSKLQKRRDKRKLSQAKLPRRLLKLSSKQKLIANTDSSANSSTAVVEANTLSCKQIKRRGRPLLQRYQAELMKGVATRMVTTHYVVRPKGG